MKYSTKLLNQLSVGRLWWDVCNTERLVRIVGGEDDVLIQVREMDSNDLVEYSMRHFCLTFKPCKFRYSR
jgi:hypothetical protein